jgi:hypothetical protein
MRNCKKNEKLRISIFSFFFALLIFFPIAKPGAAELPRNIKPILFKMISSVANPNLRSFPKDYFESEPLSGKKDAGAIAAPLNLSGIRLFFPLNHNDVKYYEGFVSGSFYSAAYRYAQIVYNGRTSFRETDSLDGSITYYGYSGSDLYMFGLSLDGENLTFDTPLRILNDSILNSGGSLSSSTTFIIEGTRVTLDISVTASLAGTVIIPLGRANDCRSIRMSFRFTIPGETESLELEDVWILSPNIGKLKIAVFDQYMVQRGWLTLTGGTVGGENVAAILKPKISGYVRTTEGVGIGGVIIGFSVGGGQATTNNSGFYSYPVESNWSGTATPTLGGYVFTPAFRQYTNVTSDWTNQNYIGAMRKGGIFPFLNLLLLGEE